MIVVKIEAVGIYKKNAHLKAILETGLINWVWVKKEEYKKE